MIIITKIIEYYFTYKIIIITIIYVNNYTKTKYS